MQLVFDTKVFMSLNQEYLHTLKNKAFCAIEVEPNSYHQFSTFAADKQLSELFYLQVGELEQAQNLKINWESSVNSVIFEKLNSQYKDFEPNIDIAYVSGTSLFKTADIFCLSLHANYLATVRCNDDSLEYTASVDSTAQLSKDSLVAAKHKV